MRKTRFLTAVLCLVTIAASTVTVAGGAPQATGSCYSDVPQWLDDNVGLLAAEILKNSDEQRITINLPDVVLYTIADAVGGDAAKVVRRATPKGFGELLRTDTQVGATSTSSGSTSAIEKPGLVDLLGFAIERGAIQQQLNDSTVTLTTSPYLLLAALKGDTPETYQSAGLLNRINGSASFLLNDKNDPLQNVRRNQLTEWSVKARLSGDRSTRSKGFHKHWDETVRPIIVKSLGTFGTTASLVFTNLVDTTITTTVAEPLKNRVPNFLAIVRDAIESELKPYIDSHRPDLKPELHPETNAKLLGEVKAIILCKLRTLVYEPVRSGRYSVDTGKLASGLTEWAKLNQEIDEAKVAIKDFLQKFATEGIVSTVAYTNHRVAGGSDYSEVKLLFERHVSNMDAVFNGGFSIYNKPDPKLNQEKLRDFSLTFSLEGKSKNPLFRGDPEFATPITYTATGRYQRLMENENMMTGQPDIANFQAKIEIPITPGLSIPVAYTYASATETMAKRENRFNIGLHFDINKVLASVRAKRAQ
jgi:hypothetical protein